MVSSKTSRLIPVTAQTAAAPGPDGNGEALRRSCVALPENSGGLLGTRTQRGARPASSALLLEGRCFPYRAIRSRGTDSQGPGHSAPDRRAVSLRQRTAGHRGHGQDGEGRVGERRALLFGERHAQFQLRHGEGVEYEIDRSQHEGDRTRNLRWHGKPLAPEQKLRIAV
jgi:hypothetical protein